MAGTKRVGTSTKSSVVYQRKNGNDTLWDDADLIRLWNAQLEQDKDLEEGPQHQDRDTRGSDGVVDSANNVSDDEEGSVVTSCEEGEEEESAEAAPVSSPAENVQCPPVRSAIVGHSLPDMMSELPEDIRRVAMAYYRAGFEAGYYMGGRKRPEGSPERKRCRN